MKNRFLSALCVSAVIILIISGVALLKLRTKWDKVPNVLPVVDTLVIEADNALVYN